MSKAQFPELQHFMDKKLNIKLNGGRNVIGILRGFDSFMNIVVDEALEVKGETRNPIGMVLIRGNSVILVEPLPERD